MVKYLFFCLSVLFLFSSTSHAEDKNDPYRVLYYLDGYKCMLADTNPKDIPNSPSPKVYDGPGKDAKINGVAVLTSLVNTRVPVINNRQAILRPNGSTGWVDVKDLHPFPEPCKGVVLANGRHGFETNPPKP